MKIGVLIPVYNAADTIGETLESILNQTVLPYEICIVDDGSTDDTETIVRKYAHKDSSILWKIVQKPNGGLGSARNSGLEVMTSDYIAFLDGDDIWTPHKLKHTNEFLEANPDTDVLYHPIWEWNSVSGIMHRRRDAKLESVDTIWLKNPITPSATVIRKEAIKWEFDTDPSIHGVEDALLWTKAFHDGLIFKRMPFVDTQYRINHGMTVNHQEHDSNVKAALQKAVNEGWVENKLLDKIDHYRSYHNGRQFHKAGDFKSAKLAYSNCNSSLKLSLLKALSSLKIKA